VSVWRSAFAHAQYVWLTYQNPDRVPWNAALVTYFHESFVPLLHDDRGDVLYGRRARSSL